MPADKLDERRAEYPGIEVRPLKFAAAELQTSHWRFLMGAVGNQATYIRQLNRVMKSLRDDLTLDGLRQGIEDLVAARPPQGHGRDAPRPRGGVHRRLGSPEGRDPPRPPHHRRPPRRVHREGRGPRPLRRAAPALRRCEDRTTGQHSFNKLVVFDEAHKYIESPDLVAGLIEVVREMRHKGTSIMVASQDPPSVPVSLIELSSQIILHKFNSPAWLKHIQKANAALGRLTPEKMANLRPGEAFIWSSKATDEAFTEGR